MDYKELNIPLENLEAGLYLIPTPIGNLEDISFRALKILCSVDILACEDTRTSGTLLKHYGIKAKKLTSYHEHNEREKSAELIEYIKSGKAAGLVSDAGTPGISDPGYRLISLCVQEDIKITALPGANALLPALTASGLPTNEFIFLGFAPQKKGRKTFLNRLADMETTIILYESTHRIVRLVNELSEILASVRRISISREISKLYEEHINGTIEQVKEIVNKRKELKGELVVVIEGKKKE